MWLHLCFCSCFAEVTSEADIIAVLVKHSFLRARNSTAILTAKILYVMYILRRRAVGSGRVAQATRPSSDSSGKSQSPGTPIAPSPPSTKMAQYLDSVWLEI